jgi:hypothetical protein
MLDGEVSSGLMSTKKNAPDAAARAYLSSIGKRGGKARISRLTPEERSELARKAARARWKRRQKSR